MHKTIEIKIAGVKFLIEDDAYFRLKQYMIDYESTLPLDEKSNVMEDIEIRIAELFQYELNKKLQVINNQDIDYVINCLGKVEPEDLDYDNNKDRYRSTKKKLFRDIKNEKIAGVCSGLSAYLDIDVTFIRIFFCIALILCGSTLWIYIIMWIIIPEAKTIDQQMAMEGKKHYQ